MNEKLKSFYHSTFGHAAIGAVLLWAALPPLAFGPLAWIAPVWWVLLIRRETLDGKRPYRTLWLVGFLFWLAELYWLTLPHWSTSFGWLALSFYFAFYLPIFIGLSRVAVHRLNVPVIAAAPVVWMGLELARAYVLTGMTMASLGHTQYRWIALIQISDLAGALGVGFVVMMVAASIGRMVPCEKQRIVYWPLLPAVAMLAAVLVYGHVRISSEAAEPAARVALIQGSIDAQLKGDPKMTERIQSHYLGLTRQALDEHEDIDLIVWPETMFRRPLVEIDADVPKPRHFKTEREFRLLPDYRRGKILGDTLPFRTPMLLGIDYCRLSVDGEHCFNSTVLVMPDGRISEPYSKMHLVMFGEYVPFADKFPWLQKFTPLPQSCGAGDRPQMFELGKLRMSPSVCYESVLSRVIRGQINTLRDEGKDPNLLVNVTNDGWYYGSTELDLHLICGVFRAVECRMPLLIAANTGFSAWIDADGRIVEQGPRRDAGVIIADVSLDDRDSWYLRHGDVAAGACLAACFFFAAVGLWKRREE